ncbi:MAG TPA: DedA family protein [Prevotellaceae bacterium]|jgi:membrane protein DedA with SNARE-associated domain|nr:DedA family protein [Prevotellaceae bacterium]
MLTDLFQGLLDELNYLNVTILMAVESSAIPFPSEIVVPPAAYMAAEKGEMSIPLVIVFATLGSCIGAAINYVVSYYVGRPIVYKFVNSRLGHICLLNQEKMERAEAYFDSKGAIATLIGRLIPGIRQLISIPAGLAKMNFGYFLLYTAIGAGAWNIVLAGLGWYLQKLVPFEQLNEALKVYEDPIKYGICVLVALVALFFIVKKYCFKKA